MRGSLSVRLQTAVVVLLFLGSMSTVLYSAFHTLILPRGEIQIRDELREASRRMAQAVEAEQVIPEERGRIPFAEINHRLRLISDRVLRAFPGVEGGFYLGNGIDRFAGYGFPTDDKKRPPPPLGEKRSGKKGPPEDSDGPRSPPPPRGDAPPPKETPFILLQVQHSLVLDSGDYQFDARAVGPSRVAIVTEPIGASRPAPVATWTMFRLTNPEDLGAQLRRYQLSTGLALGGIALAVALTINLGRTLKHQRIDQERLREDLRRSEHLASLGKLLAGVAHEVRNPLAGIRSTVQLWERLPDTARTPHSMQAIIRAVDRLNEMVSRLLYMSRSDSSERQPTDLNQVIREIFELLEAQATTQSVQLEFKPSKDLPCVSGSASGLRQVFLNLATNALQAMPDGGKLLCTTGLLPGGAMIEVLFEDTGPGVSPEDQGHLFEPFFTTRSEGTGLGLALCREILQQHQGTIELIARAGSGCAFRLLLPIIQE